MSFANLERAIVREARVVLGNARFPLKDIAEWSSSEEAVKKNLTPNEVMLHLPGIGVWIAVPKPADRREQKGAKR